MPQVVLITGASRGLGLALALRFLSRGDRVFGISRSKRHWAEALKKTQNSSHFSLAALDIQSEAAVKKYIQNLKRKAGRIDILINNAGYGGTLSRVENLPLREFERHLRANLLGTFLFCKHTLPIFRRQKGGLLLNIASMAAKRAVPRLAAYSAAKFGVLALGQAIAKENLDIFFKCITVCPGGMNTQMRSSLFGEEDARRQQSPDFVADIILQIVEDKIKLETGSDITIRHSKVTDIHVPPAN